MTRAGCASLTLGYKSEALRFLVKGFGSWGTMAGNGYYMQGRGAIAIDTGEVDFEAEARVGQMNEAGESTITVTLTLHR